MTTTKADETCAPSRRDFAKSAIATLVATPILTMITACKTQSPTTPSNHNQSSPEVLQSGADDHRPSKKVCIEGATEEHIPPMGFDGGGGSLIVEHRFKIKQKASSQEYIEDDADIQNETPQGDDPKENWLGDLKMVRVITETANTPFVTDVTYNVGGLEDCQLLFWYQDIKQSPGSHDCMYEPTDFNSKPSDVRILGGRRTAGERRFTMKMTGNLDPRDKSYKCARPHKFKEKDNSGHNGHFRVGQWRVVDKNGNVVLDAVTSAKFEDSVTSANLPEHFQFYVYFKHY